MNTIIDQNKLAEMASSLSNEELGAAVRLLNRIASTKKPISMSRARTICQMPEDNWEESSSEILSYFKIEDDKISHSMIDDLKLPPVATPPRARAGVTAEMPIVHPMKDNRVPAYVSRNKPEIISMKRTAYIMMTEIFARSDQSENTARALLASLLKTWPEGDVYEAISAADKQKYLVDPRSWIVKHLQRHSQPTVANRTRRDFCPPPERKPSKREIVTPEAIGVSSKTAEQIRNRNASLRLEIGNRKKDK